MTALDLTPGSPEWVRRISPSKIAAILGISPWDSPRALFHKMRGEVAWDEESEAMERGNLLEDGVLNWWRRHNPGHEDWIDQHSMTIGDWCVATPDASVTDRDGCRALVEAKTSSEYDAWGDPGTDEIPTPYFAQTTFAAHVFNLCGDPVDRIYVPMLGPRLRFAEYVVDYDPQLGAQLMARAEQWRDLLAGDEPPDLDDTVATWNAIRKLHPEIERGVEVELVEGEARELVEFQAAMKAIEPALRLCKSTVVDRMGRAQYATYQGVRVARRQPRGDEVTFVVVAKPADLPSSETEESAA